MAKGHSQLFRVLEDTPKLCGLGQGFPTAHPQGYPFSQGSRDLCLELLKLPREHNFIKGFCSTSDSHQVTSPNTQLCRILGSDWQPTGLPLIPRKSLP